MTEKSSTPGATRPRVIPEGYGTVTPFIITKSSPRLLEFVKAAFGGEELFRVQGEDGAIGHAEARIGTSIIMMFDARKGWPESPSFLRLYVEDCDAVYRQALQAGGTSITEPTTLHWGDRVARVKDPEGHLWWLMTRLEELDQAEIDRRAAQKPYIDALNYVQSGVFFRPET